MHEKTELKNIIYWILAIVVAFYSGSAVSVISSTYRNSIIYVAAFVVVIRVLEHGFRVSKSLRTVFLLFFSVMILITAIASNYSTFYLRIFATIYVAYEISEKVDGSILIDVYIKFMTFVTVLALAGYFAVNVLGLGDKLPKFTNLNDVAYRGILLFNYIERIPERNCALFWEPGLFATALTFALIFEMIYVNHKSIICDWNYNCKLYSWICYVGSIVCFGEPKNRTQAKIVESSIILYPNYGCYNCNSNFFEFG